MADLEVEPRFQRNPTLITNPPASSASVELALPLAEVSMPLQQLTLPEEEEMKHHRQTDQVAELSGPGMDLPLAQRLTVPQQVVLPQLAVK
jgi:hypothetical protein